MTIKKKISTEEIKKVFSAKNAEAIVDLIWSYDFGRLQETYIFDQFQNDELRETLLRHEIDEGFFEFLERLESLRVIDSQAVKDEIIRRFTSGNYHSIVYIVTDNFYDRVSEEEIAQAIEQMDYDHILNEEGMKPFMIFNYLIDLGDLKSKKLLKELVFKELKNKARDNEVIKFLINYKFISLFTKRELESIQVKAVVIENPYNTQIPPEIGDLTSLEELSISLENDVLELPDTIGNLSSLQKLDLLGCEKIKKIPQTITKLSSLKFLSLPYFISNIPDWVGSLISLEQLELSVYNLKKVPEFIKNLKNLRVLKVYASWDLNNPESQKARWLKELPNLEKLEFY